MNNSNSVNDIRTCATWFTEMLAMTTEDMFQKNLDILDQDSPKNRLPYFGLGYYYGFRSWDDTKIDPLMMYANTYAFGAFLARNFGGVDLIKNIAQNLENFLVNLHKIEIPSLREGTSRRLG